MSNFGYSMPSYFQNMPQIGKAVATPKADNVKAIKDVEEAIKARIDEVQAAGRSDESLNASGQMTALQRIDMLVDEGEILSGLVQAGVRLSNRTLLGQVPFVDDVAEEMERLEVET